MSLIENIIERCAYDLLRYKTYFLLVIFLYLLFRYGKSRNARNLPPGPWGIPVLGYLPFLSAQEPHIQLEKLRKKYGNVFGFYLGSKYAVFIGDLEKTKEALNFEEFSGRPDGAFPISEKLSHIAAINGQPWKDRRKMTVQAIRQLGVGTKMIQDVSRAQINLAVKRLEEAASSNPKHDVYVRDILTHTSISVVLSFVCGKTFPSDHPMYEIIARFLRFFAEKGSNLDLDMLLPWTKPLIKSLTAKSKTEIFDGMEDFIRNEVEFHIKNQPESPKDLIDYYLNHYQKEGYTEFPISDIIGDAQVMVFAGADTTRATTEWFLLCMAMYQDIQEKVFLEIDSFLGPTGEVRYEDRTELPYTEATILESFRYNTIAPVNAYHSALQETQFCGYNIPKDSLVFSLIWTIHNDPTRWSHPQKFYPEHFLNSNKSAVQVPEDFIPFAIGKRFCAGDKVALIETYVFCVSLVQSFHILPPEGGVKMEGNLRINMEPAYPNVKLIRRSV